MNAPDASLAANAPLFAPVVPALLALADGTVFRGRSIGAAGQTVGEVVFNTAMTGYQEILTDPSYAGQIVTLTYPHIGNIGVNGEDVESRRVFAAGLVIRDLPRLASSWRSQDDLSSYLRDANVVGIADLDTRKLTRLLRERGAQNGCIVAGGRTSTRTRGARAIEAARDAPSMAGQDLAKVVSCTAPYEWTGSTWALGDGYRAMGARALPRRRLRLRRQAQHPAHARRARLPAHRRAGADARARRAGDGSPTACSCPTAPAIPSRATTRSPRSARSSTPGLPVFGICLGHQLLGLAAGGRTLKMKFGHHGANHPVLDRDTGQVLITSQNHGFAVDPASLPDNVRVTHVSLFDDTLQGFAWKDKPVFCFQGHPEASPGPHDVGYLFDRFVKSMEKK